MTTDAIDPNLEKLVDDAFDSVKKMCTHYGIGASDWDDIYRESPSLLAKIREVESAVSGRTPLEEASEQINRWLYCWRTAFQRRVYFRKQAVGENAG